MGYFSSLSDAFFKMQHKSCAKDNSYLYGSLYHIWREN